jgi:phosphoesterase RecJ-like protein
VYDWIRQAGWTISEPMAQGLFVAIATDTGWYRYSNANSRLFREAAELIDRGANPSILYRQLYQQYSPSRLKLMVRMLESLELHCEQRVAIQTILRNDFDETGSTGRDTENLIDECQRLSTVEVAVLFVELGADETGRSKGFRCSLRSKGSVNVRQIAQKYGGGGHTMASGVNLAMTIDQAKKQILGDIDSQINPCR